MSRARRSAGESSCLPRSLGGHCADDYGHGWHVYKCCIVSRSPSSCRLSCNADMCWIWCAVPLLSRLSVCQCLQITADIYTQSLSESLAQPYSMQATTLFHISWLFGQTKSSRLVEWQAASWSDAEHPLILFILQYLFKAFSAKSSICWCYLQNVADVLQSDGNIWIIFKISFCVTDARWKCLVVTVFCWAFTVLNIRVLMWSPRPVKFAMWKYAGDAGFHRNEIELCKIKLIDNMKM